MIPSFLHHVATDLVERKGFGSSNMADLVVVMPSKRSKMFLTQELQSAVGSIIEPTYKTIEDLFAELSDLHAVDKIFAAAKLCQIYTSVVPEPMSVDRFFNWALTLIADFDDIDKHMAPVKKLFTNATDLAELDAISGTMEWDDAQLEALRTLVGTFSNESHSKILEHFVSLWAHMYDMYRQLNETLAANSQARKGYMHRLVAERLRRGDNPFLADGKRYAVIGFNILDEVEDELFRALKQAGAMFYWDYDEQYLNKETGRFMRQNIRAYGSELEADVYRSFARRKKKVTLISASGANAQTHYLPQWLAEHNDGKQAENKLAIVLANEALITSALGAIPSAGQAPGGTKAVNITMGYPIIHLPVYAKFIDALRSTLSKRSALPSSGEAPYNLEPLLDMLADYGQAVTQSTTLPQMHKELYVEATYRLYQLVVQFVSLVSEGLTPAPETLRNLMTQAAKSLSVPFHGSMSNGVQVMGLLETRCLDFRHIVMLSTEEGHMPHHHSETTLIPYCLREAYKLNTIERQTLVYDYYFQRLLQRADTATYLYSESDKDSGAEPSRFLLQLQAFHNPELIDLSHGRLQADGRPSKMEDLPVAKTPEMMERFVSERGGMLSPTLLGTYLTCPMRFYYTYIQHLRQADDPTEEVDNPLLGRIFHRSAELFYDSITHRRYPARVSASMLTPFLADRMLLRPFVVQAFVDEGHYETTAQQAQGFDIIAEEIVQRYLANLVRLDHLMAQRGDIIMEEPETELFANIEAGGHTFTIGGRVDRMDRVVIGGEQVTRIVDYKTGKEAKDIADVAQLFERQPSQSRKDITQTLIYARALQATKSQPTSVAPCLLYIRKATNPASVAPELTFSKGRPLCQMTDEEWQTFDDELRGLIEEILDPTLVFARTPHRPEACKYCDYKPLCGI